MSIVQLLLGVTFALYNISLLGGTGTENPGRVPGVYGSSCQDRVG